MEYNIKNLKVETFKSYAKLSYSDWRGSITERKEEKKKKTYETTRIHPKTHVGFSLQMRTDSSSSVMLFSHSTQNYTSDVWSVSRVGIHKQLTGIWEPEAASLHHCKPPRASACCISCREELHTEACRTSRWTVYTDGTQNKHIDPNVKFTTLSINISSNHL